MYDLVLTSFVRSSLLRVPSDFSRYTLDNESLRMKFKDVLNKHCCLAYDATIFFVCVLGFICTSKDVPFDGRTASVLRRSRQHGAQGGDTLVSYHSLPRPNCVLFNSRSSCNLSPQKAQFHLQCIHNHQQVSVYYIIYILSA